MRKYEFTEETKIVNGDVVLHRIRAVRDFGDVESGDLGGWIEKEDNLSHDGLCWVRGNAKIYGDAKVFDNAEVFDKAEVYGNAKVYGEAGVGDCAKIYDKAEVYGNAWVRIKAKVYGNAEICDSARVHDYAKIYGKAEVYGNAEVYGYAEVFGASWVYCYAKVGGRARVCDSARVYDDALVYGDAKVLGTAKVRGRATIYGDAKVMSEDDYSVHQNTWSSHRWFTYTRSNRMWKVGCFYGTGEELVAKAYKDSELSGRCYEIIVRAQEAIESVLGEDEKGKGEAE